MSGLESGIRPNRLEWVAESTEGEPPSDPDWNKFSDQVQSIEPSMQPTIDMRRSLGDKDIQSFSPGSEDHTFAVSYDLMQALTSDAAIDGIDRNSNNCLKNTHTIVSRDILGDDSRLYTVATGAKIGTVTLSGDPGSGEPVVVDLDYTPKKERVFRIVQPSSGTTLEVVSSDAGDTSQTLTIEDDDAGTSEDVNLNGTTAVTTTATFSSIDAARLDAETDGDITISDGGGTTFMTIYGKSSYDDRIGDLGVPALGSGSHASAIGGSMELFLGDTFTRGGSALLNNVDISSVDLTVENNLETNSSHLEVGKTVSEGVRDVNVTTSVFGEKASYDSLVEALQVTTGDIVWTMSNSTITVSGAALTGPGSIARETAQAVMTIDNEWTGKSISVT